MTEEKESVKITSEKVTYRDPEKIFEMVKKLKTGEYYKECRDKFHVVFRWLQSDSPTASGWWHWVHLKHKQFSRRDEFVIEIWKSLDNETSGKNKDARSQIENEITDWSYYQNHFFHWFLQGRYHIPYARNVFSDNKMINIFHRWFWFFPLAVILNYYLFFYHQDYSYVGAIVAVFLLGLFSVCAAKKWGPIEPCCFIHSTVPRLGATIAIGYFFLLSVPEFVKKIYDNSFNPIFQIIGSVALILFVLGFIFLNIQKRVKPELKYAELAIRTLDLFAIAATYAMIGLLVFERVFFITFKPEISKPCFSQLFFFASISLAIGVIFQLIWEEKPVTEPL